MIIEGGIYMTWMQAIILGIVQGITEFLPISSSGHLVVLQHFFGIKEGNLFFTEMLHFGTLISILIVYFNDIINIIGEFFKLIHKSIKNKKIRIENAYQKLGLFIIVGSIPTAIIGIAFEDFFKTLYAASLLPIGISFMITGFLLWISSKKSKERKNVGRMSFFDSIIIGLCQGIAIVPGISRSGTTIVAGLLRGLNRNLATEFSFLLAAPAIFGAGLLGIIDVVKVGEELAFSLPLLLGVIISALVGIIAIKFLISALKKNKLHYFSYYLWGLGLITIITHFV